MGVTGRFGKGEPAYAHEIFARPVGDPSLPTEPMRPWFLRLLQGSTASYAHLQEAADDLGTGGSQPTSLASDNAKTNFASSMLLSTLSALKPISPTPFKRPVVLASALPTLTDASLASRPSVTARTVVSPSEVTSPFVPLLIEAVDEDVHSERGVMSPAPGIGSGNTRWTGVSSGNRPKF